MSVWFPWVSLWIQIFKCCMVCTSSGWTAKQEKEDLHFSHSMNKSHHLFVIVLITWVYVASCMKRVTWFHPSQSRHDEDPAISLRVARNPLLAVFVFQVCLQKQSLERDLEDVRGKLKNTEADLKESQKREAQTEAKLTVQQHAQSQWPEKLKLRLSRWKQSWFCSSFVTLKVTCIVSRNEIG